MTFLTKPHVRIAIWVGAFFTMLLTMDSLLSELQAQQENEPAAAEQPPAAGVNLDENADGQTESDGDESVAQMLLDTGPVGIGFMVVLLLFSLLATTVSVERLARLRRRLIMPSTFVSELRDLIHRHEDSAKELDRLCRSSNTVISRILHAAVLRAGRTLPEVEKAMEDAAQREMGRLRSRNRPISVVGNVAPLVGLLGTVVGMIVAFKTSSEVGVGGADKGAQLAEGIYLALTTTAAGLSIAIPCLLVVPWFNAKIERFMQDIDEVLMETMPSFSRMEDLAAKGEAGESETAEWDKVGAEA